ncbi:MAG TPA: AtpZ/AtpI family protein [Caulobacteraceae bacterium]|nr:AtpZ/AtpI family protein [Caulobacteraceae bacterium]
MPESEDPSERLARDLARFQASRAPRAPSLSNLGEAGVGYRLLANLLGGVFVGAGLGWTLDHFVHTSPLGLIGGLLIGLGVSIYWAVRTALAVSAKAEASAPAAAAPDGDEDED